MSFFSVTLRLGAHRFASAVSRHSLSASQRYGIVRAALQQQQHGMNAFGREYTTKHTSAGTFRSMAESLLFGNRFQIRRGYTSNTSGSIRRLQQLEAEANSAPANAEVQVAYLRELGRSHPEEVIRRFESGMFANSEASSIEYANALRRAGESSAHYKPQQGSQQLGSIFGRNAQAEQQAAYTNNFGGGGSAAGRGASPQDPVHVVVAQAGQKEKFLWSALKSSLLLFLAISFIGVAFEDKLTPGGALKSMQKDVKPQEDVEVTFGDVKGVDEAKEELQEVVEFLKEPERFTRLGGKLPKGVLLTGPPGTGKTLLAKAVAGEAGVPFYYMSGSEFEEVFVGVGARRVRDLFKNAKASSPCIIFIDEIDAIGCRRSERQNVSTKATLNQLLVEMDGFQSKEGVIVVAATNFPEILDPALLRPGRFDRKVQVGLPDRNGRRQILELYVDRIPAANDINLLDIAKGTPGASGADLFNLVNEASLRASMERRPEVTDADLRWAKDKIQMGKESKSRILTPEDLKCTAFHEAGHALVAMLTPGADRVEKATIMPRGRALGYVLTLPEASEVSTTKKRLLARMDVAMGGRIAEELVFGADEITTGAASDMQSATKIARHMVTECGFGSWSGGGGGGTGDHAKENDRFGLLYENDPKKLSGSAQAMVESEMRELLNASYERAKNMLTKHKKQHRWIAEALLEHETLTGDELALVFQGRKLKK